MDVVIVSSITNKKSHTILKFLFTFRLAALSFPNFGYKCSHFGSENACSKQKESANRSTGKRGTIA